MNMGSPRLNFGSAQAQTRTQMKARARAVGAGAQGTPGTSYGSEIGYDDLTLDEHIVHQQWMDLDRMLIERGNNINNLNPYSASASPRLLLVYTP